MASDNSHADTTNGKLPPGGDDIFFEKEPTGNEGIVDKEPGGNEEIIEKEPPSGDVIVEKEPSDQNDQPAEKEGMFEKLYAGRAALSAFYTALHDHGVFASAPHVYDAIQANLLQQDPFAPSMELIHVEPHVLLDIEAKMRMAVSSASGEGPHGAITTGELQHFLTDNILVGALEHLQTESQRQGGMPDSIMQASERQLTALLGELDMRVTRLGSHFPEGASLQTARVCGLEEQYQHYGAGNVPMTGQQMHDLIATAIAGLESPICGTAPDLLAGHGLSYTKDSKAGEITR